MNWTGGRLQRHSKSNGRKDSLVEKQRQHFAKVRTTLQNGPIPSSPFRPNILPQDWMKTNASAVNSNAIRADSTPGRQQRLEEFPSVAPLAKRLSTLGSQRSSQITPTRTKHKRSSSPISVPARIQPSNEFIEATRQQLLQQPDWVGLYPTRPLHMDFASSHGRSNVGKRRKITVEDQLRRQTLMGRTRVPSINGQFMMSGALQTGLHTEEDESIKIRIGDEALYSQVSGWQSHRSLATAGSINCQSEADSFQDEELRMSEEPVVRPDVNYNAEVQDLPQPMAMAPSTTSRTTNSCQEASSVIVTHLPTVRPCDVPEQPQNDILSIVDRNSSSVLAQDDYSLMATRMTSTSFEGFTSDDDRPSDVSPSGGTDKLTSVNGLSSPTATRGSTQVIDETSPGSIQSPESNQAARVDEDMEALWKQFMNVPPESTITAASVSVSAKHDHQNREHGIGNEDTTECPIESERHPRTTTKSPTAKKTQSPGPSTVRASARQPTDPNQAWMAFVFGRLPHSANSSRSSSPDITALRGTRNSRKTPAINNNEEEPLLSSASIPTNPNSNSSLAAQVSDQDRNPSFTLLNIINDNTRPTTPPRDKAITTIITTTTQTTPPSRPSSLENASIYPDILRSDRLHLPSLQLQRRPLTLPAMTNGKEKRVMQEDSSSDPLTRDVQLLATSKTRHRVVR